MWTVATAVETAQGRRSHVRDGLLGAQDRPAERVRGHDRAHERLVQQVLGVVVAHGDLFEYDLPFQVHIHGPAQPVEHHIADQIHRQRQILVHDMGVVAGLLLGGERVELTADRVHGLGDIEGRTGRGGLEQQVFQEMRGTGDGGPLVARADSHPDPHGRRADAGDVLGHHSQATRQDRTPHTVVDFDGFADPPRR